MIIKDISFASAEENILYDEKLLDLAEQGLSGEILRFWEAPEFFIVLGRISKQEIEVKIEEAAADGVKMIKRCSGGGANSSSRSCPAASSRRRTSLQSMVLAMRSGFMRCTPRYR